MISGVEKEIEIILYSLTDMLHCLRMWAFCLQIFSILRTVNCC